MCPYLGVIRSGTPEEQVQLRRTMLHILDWGFWEQEKNQNPTIRLARALEREKIERKIDLASLVKIAQMVPHDRHPRAGRESYLWSGLALRCSGTVDFAYSPGCPNRAVHRVWAHHKFHDLCTDCTRNVSYLDNNQAYLLIQGIRVNADLLEHVPEEFDQSDVISAAIATNTGALV